MRESPHAREAKHQYPRDVDALRALERWQAEGLIDDALAAKLRLSLDQHDEPERSSKIIWTLASIGAVLIGGGLLLFIASQWDQSAPTRRLLLLFAVYVATVAAAAVADRRGFGISAKALWFLTTIVAGANIFLIGQVFNLTINYWQGTLLWMLAALAMGWASPSTAQGWLVVPLGILTLGWLSVPSSRFYEQWAYLFDSDGLRPILPYLGLGLLSCAALLRATSWEWLRRPLNAFGAALLVGPVIISTVAPDAYYWAFEMDKRLLQIGLMLLSAGALGLMWVKDRASLVTRGAVAVFAVLFAVTVHVNVTKGAFNSNAESFFDFTWLYVIVAVTAMVATIIAGRRESRPTLVNAGFAALSLELLVLYWVRIGGALPTALAAIGGGALLVFGAIKIERTRRAMLSEVATGAANASEATDAIGSNS